MTIPLAFTIGIFAGIVPYLSSGPLFPYFPEIGSPKGCEKYGWLNIVYLNIYNDKIIKEQDVPWVRIKDEIRIAYKKVVELSTICILFLISWSSLKIAFIVLGSNLVLVYGYAILLAVPFDYSTHLVQREIWSYMVGYSFCDNDGGYWMDHKSMQQGSNQHKRKYLF